MGKVDARTLAQAGFRYLGRSYSEMDCQAFVERCLADCGNHTDLGGSNSWFRICMEYLEETDKTVYARVKKMRDEFYLKKKRIYRREPLENKGSEDDDQNSSSTLN